MAGLDPAIHGFLFGFDFAAPDRVAAVKTK